MELITRVPNSQDPSLTPGPAAPLPWSEADEPDRRSIAAREQAIQAVLAAVDVEQAFITRLLHDNVGQNVAALLLGFKGLERELKTEAEAQLTLQSLHAIAQNIGQELHKIALDLRPSALDDHGLSRALGTFLDEWSVVEKVRVEFDWVSLGERRLARPTEATLFRVVRHALHYISKSPHASHLSVILQRSAEWIGVVMENTGEPLVGNSRGGLTPESHLETMRARLSLVGGTVTIEPRYPQGVAVFVRLPLPAGDFA